MMLFRYMIYIIICCLMWVFLGTKNITSPIDNFLSWIKEHEIKFESILLVIWNLSNQNINHYINPMPIIQFPPALSTFLPIMNIFSMYTSLKKKCISNWTTSYNKTRNEKRHYFVSLEGIKTILKYIWVRLEVSNLHICIIWRHYLS